MEMEELTGGIIECAMKVHTALGPGLLESVYEVCLKRELEKRGLRVQAQVCLPLCYDGETIDQALRIDLLVEERVIIELKAVEQLLPVHKAQAISYLKLSGHEGALLINFNVGHLREGIRRFTRRESAFGAAAE